MSERITHREIVYSTGGGEENFIELMILDRVVFERGSGPDYQKTVITFDAESSSRVTSTKTVTVGDREFEVTVVDRMVMERGSGPDYQRTVYNFTNWAENDRVIHVKSVPVHESSPVEVEVIDRKPRHRGSGPDYQRTVVAYDQTPPDGFDQVD